ncbi:MAG: hypothetical protein O3C23_02005 [bacterium]|nr:hypothetical protein [bacterium]
MTAQTALTTQYQGLAKMLLDIEVIKFGAFRLKLHEANPTAPLSPIYIDFRVIRSFPDARTLVVGMYHQELAKIQNSARILNARDLPFDVLADVPTAATPFVAILAHELQVPMVTPRRGEKTHGSGAAIDGAFLPGQRALVIDDLVTKAGSKLKAIETLENGGLVVSDVLVILDREQGGKEELEARGYNLHSIFNLSTLLTWYAGGGLISEEKYDEAMAYLTANS